MFAVLYTVNSADIEVVQWYIFKKQNNLTAVDTSDAVIKFSSNIANTIKYSRQLIIATNSFQGGQTSIVHNGVRPN